eukprot:11203633-Lingulodinium_polyedra.AAC.1
MQYARYSRQQTADSRQQQTTHSTQHTAYSIQYRVYNNSIRFTVYGMQHTMYIQYAACSRKHAAFRTQRRTQNVECGAQSTERRTKE